MKKIFIGLVFVLFLLVIFIISSSFIGSRLKQMDVAPTGQTSPYKKEDINRDGRVDNTDTEIIRENLNCQKTQPCWGKVIGKTLSGDNPIYTYDLDLNGDGVISTLDMALVK